MRYKTFSFTTLIAFGVLCSTHVSAECEAHAAAMASLPAPLATYACVATQFGVVLASDANSAKAEAAVYEESAQNFVRSFGRPPAPILVIQADESVQDPSAPQSLQWTKSFAVDAVLLRRQAGLGAGLIAGLRQKMPTKSDAELAQIAHMIQGQMQSQGLQAQALRDDGIRTALAHRFLHQHAFAKSKRSDRYGSAAPDWFDELVASQFASQATQSKRRDARRTATSPAPSLASLLARTEKDRLIGQHDAAAAPVGMSVQVISTGTEDAIAKAEKLRAQAQASSLMQAYVSGFGDFLRAQSNKPVLDSLAQALARGQSFERWLASDGQSFALPENLESLERQWQSWLIAAKR